MYSQHLFRLVYGLCSALLIKSSLAVQLQPIDLLEHEAEHVVARGNDYSKLDLLSAETFLWGGLNGKGKYALGNFTTYMPGKHESIISMEKFYPLLKSTECTQNSMTLNFEDDGAYRYGAKVWKWVNDAKNHTFLLVAGHGHCKWNIDRLPFIVTDVEFCDESNTIKALGRVSDWINATHSYDLFVGGRAQSNKRDYDSGFTFDITADLPLSHINLGDGDLKITYDCFGCGTKGEFKFDFHIKSTLGVPNDIELILSPQDVQAIYEPRLGIQANIGEAWTEELPLGTIPFDGISIAGGILDLGPEIKFALVGSVGPLQGSAGVTGGGTLGLEDSASLTIDLLNPNIAASGWSPTWSEKPITFDAAIRGSLQMSLDIDVVLALDALGHGFNIGVKLQPFYGATLSLAESSGDVCPNDPGKHFGLKYLPSAGVNFIGEANLIDNTESPIVSATLLSWVHTFETYCTGLDSGISTPTGSFSSHSYSIPYTSSPTPHYLTSAPPSSFPTPLPSIPRPSSWLTPRPSSSTPASSPSWSSSIHTPSLPSSSATTLSIPHSSVTTPPIPHSSGGLPPPPPPPASSSSSSSLSSVVPVVRRRYVVPRQQTHAHA